MSEKKIFGERENEKRKTLRKDKHLEPVIISIYHWVMMKCLPKWW